jgi:hypothetical protein
MGAIEMISKILIIEQVEKDFITVIAPMTLLSIKERIMSLGIMHDEYLKEDLYEFFNEFSSKLAVSNVINDNEHTEMFLSVIYKSICDNEMVVGSLRYLLTWFVANPTIREDYVNEATIYLITECERIPTIHEILTEAKLRETLEVYRKGYEFIKWYFGIKQEA